METVLPYAIEPELLAAPPRRARLPWTTGILLGLTASLLVVFLAAGACVEWEAARMMHLNAAGRTVAARIVSMSALPPAGPGQKPIMEIRYRYRWPFGAGEQRSGRAQSPQTTLHTGDLLPVRCAVGWGQSLAVPGGRIPAAKIVFTACCGVLLAGVSGMLLAQLVGWRARRLHLLRWGTATVGTIVQKRTQAEDRARYFLRFGYAADGAAYECEEQVTVDAWKRAEVGQSVTVLIDPARPVAASLYTA